MVLNFSTKISVSEGRSRQGAKMRGVAPQHWYFVMYRETTLYESLECHTIYKSNI